MEEPSPLCVVPPLGCDPGFCKKAGWASHDEQAGKQHPSVASASAPASRLLPCLSSCLTSFSDGLWYGGINNTQSLCTIGQSLGSPGEFWWGSSGDVYQKPEPLIQSNHLLRWTFASKADWTKGCIMWHTPPNAPRTNETLERRERRKSEEGLFCFLFMFLFVCLLCFILVWFFLIFLLEGAPGVGRGYGETGRWEELGCMKLSKRSVKKLC